MRYLTIFLGTVLFASAVMCWCDPEHFQCQKGAYGCEELECRCKPGWRSTFPVSDVCEPVCGDYQVVDHEECDGGYGCCGCKCAEGFEPTYPRSTNCTRKEEPHHPHIPCKFQTYTQQDYGHDECRNGNAACILKYNFEHCFPRGLRLGAGECPKRVNFTEAHYIRRYLPTRGQPEPFERSYLNPRSEEQTGGGVFAGELLAAVLNVRFDECVEGFGTCRLPLKYLCFVDRESPCYGYTVKDIVEVSQYVIGEGSNDLCVEQTGMGRCCQTPAKLLTQCLADFNRAFDNQQSHPRDPRQNGEEIDGESEAETLLRRHRVLGLCPRREEMPVEETRGQEEQSGQVDSSTDTKTSDARVVAGAGLGLAASLVLAF